MFGMGQQELVNWLIEQCNARNEHWSVASKKAGVAQNSISEIVNGTVPGLSRLRRLARYFDVPVGDLLRLLEGSPGPSEEVALQQWWDEVTRMVAALPDEDREYVQRGIMAIARDAYQRTRQEQRGRKRRRDRVKA